MKIVNVIVVVLGFLVFTSCSTINKEEMELIGKQKCVTLAPFIKTLGFDTKKSAFSTTVANKTGIVLIQINGNPNDTNNIKVYQKESWKQFGHMGSITTGKDGTIYTAPIPFVNMVETPISKMNIIYRINPIDGELKEFCTLPKADTSTGVVPFAVLGLYYDCHGNKLYVSTVAGSTRDNENGIIYVIDVDTKKIVDEKKGIDALGLFVSGITGKKMLFYGKARTSNVECIELSKNGTFVGKPSLAFSLDQIGVRGDDKVRRIRQLENDNFVATGVEFNFSLAAPSGEAFTPYVFRYNEEEKKWDYIK